MTKISTRQLEIIDAAGKLLTNNGINKLTIKNLALEMGFTESALYRHFKSKEEIIIEMLTLIKDSLIAVYSLNKSKDESAEVELKALLLARLQYFNEHPHFIIAVFSEGLMGQSENINTAVNKLMAITSAHIKPVLLKGQENNEFRSDLSIEDLTHIVMGSIRLQLLKWKLSGFNFNFLDNGNQLINSIIKLIKTN